MQTLLWQLGPGPSPSDGTIGEKIRDAIRSHQEQLSLPVDWGPSDDMLQHLRKIIRTG